MTSHSSQGQTADRVLVHVDTERASEKLVNRRLCGGVRVDDTTRKFTPTTKPSLPKGWVTMFRATATQPHRESAGPAKRESPELELERERERTRTQSYDIGR